MSLAHGAAGTTDGSTTTTGGNERLHPASDKEDIVQQPGLRAHGSGKNGPDADFRSAGTAYESVRKSGANVSPNAATHDIDSLKQHNAS